MSVTLASFRPLQVNIDAGADSTQSRTLFMVNDIRRATGTQHSGKENEAVPAS
jgi:hypothetical protein